MPECSPAHARLAAEVARFRGPRVYLEQTVSRALGRRVAGLAGLPDADAEKARKALQKERLRRVVRVGMLWAAWRAVAASVRAGQEA